MPGTHRKGYLGLMGSLGSCSQRRGVLRLPADSPNQSVYLVAYLLALWTFAGAFVAYVEDPAMVLLERWHKRVGQTPRAAALVVGGFGAVCVAFWTLAVLDTLLLWKLSVFDVEYTFPRGGYPLGDWLW